MRLTMVGTGYVGLVTGVCFANTGNHVTCLDVDAGKIEKLKKGECPIYEPGLTELMERSIAAKRLDFTLDKKAAYKDAEMIFICVGTPSDERGHTDLKYINSAADDIADVLKSLGPKQSPKVIVMKSTVPVGHHARRQGPHQGTGRRGHPVQGRRQPRVSQRGCRDRRLQQARPRRCGCGG
jgi:UDPglucose 6-dehydrogenase